jgi:hypothetical protein
MAKSSLDYTELAGLNIALANLQVVDITYQDEGWVAVIDWMKQRIKQLSSK